MPTTRVYIIDNTDGICFLSTCTHSMSVFFQRSLIPAVVQVGFLREMYSAQEVEGSVTVEFGILQGTLERDVIVDFNYISGTAVGECIKLRCKHPNRCYSKIVNIAHI